MAAAFMGKKDMTKIVCTTPRLIFLLLLAASAALSGATDHIVGGHLGWNSNINYTDWSNNQTFFVDDLISFRYQKNMHNVFEVNKTGYDNCTMDGKKGNWSSGKDFITLSRPGNYYFICGNGLCFSGMKIAIKVVPLPSPPTSPSHSLTLHSSSAATASSSQTPLAGLISAAALAAAAWFTF